MRPYTEGVPLFKGHPFRLHIYNFRGGGGI